MKITIHFECESFPVSVEKEYPGLHAPDAIADAAEVIKIARAAGFTPPTRFSKGFGPQNPDAYAVATNVRVFSFGSGDDKKAGLEFTLAPEEGKLEARKAATFKPEALLDKLPEAMSGYKAAFIAALAEADSNGKEFPLPADPKIEIGFAEHKGKLRALDLRPQAAAGPAFELPPGTVVRAPHPDRAVQPDQSETATQTRKVDF